jgi:hypothetical protein
MIYSDEIAEHTGEETSYTNATTGHKYNAPFDGRLIQLKLAFAQTAVTSVIQTCLAKVESASFGGRTAIVMLNGAGLMTAPAFPTPIGVLNCDLPVRTAQELKTQFRHQAGGLTPVTVNMLLLGVFEG